MLRQKRKEYNAMYTVPKLKELCIEKGIPVKQGLVKKAYIDLLIKHHFENGEYTKAQEQNVKYLVIGGTAYENLPDTCIEERTHFTGNRNVKHNTIDWIDFIEKPPIDYLHIYLLDISFIEQSDQYEKIYTAITKALKPQGSITLIQKGNFTLFKDFMKENGFVENILASVRMTERDTSSFYGLYTTYHRPQVKSSFSTGINTIKEMSEQLKMMNKIIPDAGSSSINQTQTINTIPKPIEFKVEIAEEKKSEKKEAKKRTFKKCKIRTDKEDVEDFCKDVEANSITFEKFADIVDTEGKRGPASKNKFILGYIKSLENILLFKLEKYSVLYRNAQSLIDEQDRKTKTAESLGILESKENKLNKTKLQEELIEYYSLLEIVSEKKLLIPTPDEMRDIFTEILYDSERGLGSITGREEIKNAIIQIIYSFGCNYKFVTGTFINMAFMGSAGTGKTRIAEVMGWVMGKCGILLRGTFRCITRADIIGQYIGHTAPLTRGVIFGSLEGVLLIDEAYRLGPGQDNHRDFGHEAITEIVALSDRYRGLHILAVAGYYKRMKKDFFGSNEGLERRFPYQFILSDYSSEELTNILLNIVEDKLGISLQPKICNYIYSLVDYYYSLEIGIFEHQAGSMHNLSAVLMSKIYSYMDDDMETDTDSFNIFEPENEKTFIKVIRKSFIDFQNKVIRDREAV